MNRLGYCAPCAAAANPIPLLGSYKKSTGLGEWYVELKEHLQPMLPWMAAAAIVSGFAGYKLGKWRCSGLFLAREARVISGVPAKKKRSRKK